MQPQTTIRKIKYKIDHYASQGNPNPITQNYSQNTTKTLCICQQSAPSNRLQTCQKCKMEYHVCVQSIKLLGEHYQCCCCLARYADPLYSVRKAFLQTFYKTESIFKYTNIINFHFYLTVQDMNYPLQIRGFERNNLDLKWPMQGSFYINDGNTPFHELKPLLVNSNRKNRKQEYISVPIDKLNLGKNVLSFRIIRINQPAFMPVYQYEERGVYFLGLYSICQLSSEQLISKVLKDSRLQKKDSLQILKRYQSSEVQMDKTKIRLVCLYTKERIKIPVRGKYCKHFMCVCLKTLIIFHSKSRIWKCPVCGKKINQPKVDIWMLEILSDNQSGVDVIISTNGTYQWAPTTHQVMQLSDDDQKSPDYKHAIVQQSEIKPKQQQTPKISKVDTQKVVNPLPQTQIVQVDDPIDVDTLKEAEHQTKQKIKQKIREQLRNKKKQKKTVEKNFEKKEKQGPKICDVKQIRFKEISYKDYARKYFRIPNNSLRRNIPEDLKNIFREVI